MVDTGDLFCGNGWVPWAWEQGGDDIEFLGVVEESLGERDGLVLIFLLRIDQFGFKELRRGLTAPYPAMNLI